MVNFPRLLSANPTKYQTAYFKVIENIDMRSVSKDAYIPSTTGFSGEFNGNYKIIKHLSLTTGILMSGQYLVGMFSNLNPGSLVKNVNLYKPLVKLNNTNEYYGSKLNLVL